MKNLTINFFTFIFLLLTLNAAAQESVEAEDITPLSITGNVDAYYRYSNNKVGAKTSYTDAAQGFSLGMANICFAKEVGKVGFVADIMFGPRANATNYYYTGSLVAIKQLYVTYKPTEKAKFTFGNFMTYFGYELVEASNNLNYTMSYNYTNGPFFHTGVKLDYQFTPKFGGMLGVFNAQDTKIDNGKKYVGGQLSYIDGGFKVYLNGLTGKNDVGDTTGRRYNTLGLTASYQVAPKFGVAVDVLSLTTRLKDSTNNVFGTAIYANYAASDKFTLAARYEIFQDKDNYTGIGALGDTFTAFTLSGNIKIDALTIIPEITVGSDVKKKFLTDLGVAKKSETAFILAVVYKF